MERLYKQIGLTNKYKYLNDIYLEMLKLGLKKVKQFHYVMEALGGRGGIAPTHS
jgi:hypothetical protein